jgi:DNA-binding NarL/FixJ family response regulator
MSFTGDLVHLPIVDVIQLLHATRKSGILRIACHKGESHLVFKEGYIVSANHLNSSVRIGTILVERKFITADILDQELHEQEKAGRARKPLIISLLEKGLVKEEDAYRGLEQLIEMTVVEILTWKKGAFTFDLLPETTADAYRYYPGRLSNEINVDTQGVLMDALRIYDEKIRDGMLTDEEFPEDEAAALPPAGNDIPILSAEDLGLADLDNLETKIPEVFTGLKESDPAQVHLHKLAACAPDLPPEQRDEIVSFLSRFPVYQDIIEEAPRENDRQPPLFFFSHDELFRHAITTICRHAGILAFATDEELNLGMIMARSLALDSRPILVLDSTSVDVDTRSDGQGTTRLRQLRKKYPSIDIIQLAPPDNAGFMLDAYEDGVRAVIPRPSRTARPATFAGDAVKFFGTFQACLLRLTAEQERSSAARLAGGIASLRGLQEAQDVANALLRFTAGLFTRALTLVVRGSELVADKGVGIDAGTGESTPLGFRVPLTLPSQLRSSVETGRLHYGPDSESVIREHLFGAIGTPRSPFFLLLPVRFLGKTIALIYGDFGDRQAEPVGLDQLAIMAAHAELLLENASFRKKLDKRPVTGQT